VAGNAQGQRRNRPLVLIDIAVPRDIDADVQFITNVYLYDIDELEASDRDKPTRTGPRSANWAPQTSP